VGDRDAALGPRRGLAGLVGGPVTFVRQVHGAAVLAAPLPGGGSGPADDVPYDEVPAADALVAGRGDAVAVLVADCVPVLLADASAGVVAAVHAGRRGLVAGVVEAAVAAMVAGGAEVDRIRGAVGPSIAGESYEVPAALQDEVAEVVPETGATTDWGTPALDLPAGVVAVLRRTGVARVSLQRRDTWKDPALFSYRRSQRTGRFAGVVGLQP